MRQSLRQPVRIVPLVFLGAIAVGTLLLLVPVSRREPGNLSVMVALFTAASAVCVVGLNVVETPTYWSDTGLVIITVLTQVGGFGIIAMATLLSLVVSQRLGLRGRLVAQTETSALGVGNPRRLLVRIALVSLTCEAVVSVLLAGRFWLSYDYPVGRALWYGLFHAVQAFNNGGFALYPNSLRDFVGDWWICLPLACGVLLGSLGFPVLFELSRNARRPSRWSTHTRLTLWGSLVLMTCGLVGLLIFEWRNPHTLGPLGGGEKFLAALFQDLMARSGGFSTINTPAMSGESITLVTALMFIGGGSASTAGGIKVSTFFLLVFIVWAEVRGEPDVVVGKRRIAEATQRVAVTVLLLGMAVVSGGALAVVALSDGVTFYRALFESASAFGTSGLSVLPTATLPPAAQVVLVGLMFVGRVGVITLASGIALNTRPRYYRYPEERPIVG